MSYFDHVRCHACKSMLDPERLATVQGQGMSCPQCKAPLTLTDLFGLADAFAEDEAPDMTLEDLLAPVPEQDFRAAAEHSVPRRPASPAPGRPAGPAPRRPATPAPSSGEARRLAGPASGTAGLVRRGERSEEPAERESPSALDLMRSMRKKK